MVSVPTGVCSVVDVLSDKLSTSVWPRFQVLVIVCVGRHTVCRLLRNIEAYTGRGAIEVTFEEVRERVGLETARGRFARTILRAERKIIGARPIVGVSQGNAYCCRA